MEPKWKLRSIGVKDYDEIAEIDVMVFGDRKTEEELKYLTKHAKLKGLCLADLSSHLIVSYVLFIVGDQELMVDSVGRVGIVGDEFDVVSPLLKQFHLGAARLNKEVHVIVNERSADPYLYQNMGYIAIDVIPNYFDLGTDGFLMKYPS